MSSPEKPEETAAQVAERLYREHGPMPDHLLQKVAAAFRDAHRNQADTKKPA